MHDMRIALDLHKLADLDASRCAHSSDVVTSEVNEHDMLGSFLGIIFQFLGEMLVTLSIYAAGTCPGNGPNGDFVVLKAHQQFWRCSYDMKILHIQVEHIR